MKNLSYLSYTKMSTYTNCSLKYFFSYEEKIKVVKSSIQRDFGTSIHDATGAFHQAITKESVPEKAFLLEKFEESWEDKCMFSESEIDIEESKHYTNLGRSFLNIYYDKNVSTGWFNPPLMVEKFLKLPLINLQTGEIITTQVLNPETNKIEETELGLYVVADLIVPYEDKIVIIDHKTAAKDYSDHKVKTDMQLTIYQYALQYLIAEGEILNPDNLDINVGFNLFIKTKEPKIKKRITTRTDGDIERMLLIAKGTQDGVSKRVFLPNDASWCSTCDYREPCQMWGKFGSRWKEEFDKAKEQNE